MTEQDPWDLTYEDDIAAVTDERLVYELLCGVTAHTPNTRLRTMYPTGRHERVARAAIARLIRKGSPFPGFIRETMAAMFDPVSATVPIERRFEIKRLRTGRKTNPGLTVMVAMHVWQLQIQGDKKEAAIASAMKRFRLERSRVYDICRKYAQHAPEVRRKRKSPIK